MLNIIIALAIYTVLKLIVTYAIRHKRKKYNIVNLDNVSKLRLIITKTNGTTETLIIDINNNKITIK